MKSYLNDIDRVKVSISDLMKFNEENHPFKEAM